MEDCIENQQEQVCNEEQNRCVTLSISAAFGMKGFGKECLNDISCQEYQIPGYCEQNIGGECEITCCDSSLCN